MVGGVLLKGRIGGVLADLPLFTDGEWYWKM
jgi:hypothetical protein